MKLIKNAFVLVGRNSKPILQDVLYDENIIEIGKDLKVKDCTGIIDLAGKLLIPGCLDAHVHFNDPGYNRHETFTTGTAAAAFGGITTVIDMPCTSIPPVTSASHLKEKLAVIERKAYVDFALWGGIRRNDFPLPDTMIDQLWQEGIVGFKIYTISGMDTFQALSYADIREVFCRFPNYLFAFHAEDADIIKKATAGLSAAELSLPENYPKSRPVTAEIEAVKQILALAKGKHLHFVHVGSADAAELILQSQTKEDITWETCPHYLQFTAADYPVLQGRLKTAPPVKTLRDRDFLRSALCRGKVDFITTDHAGCDWKTEKDLEDFSQVYNGIPGTQLLIPYLCSEFYQSGLITLPTLIRLTSEHPAKRYGLYPRKGTLQPGSDADFTVIDLNKPLRVDETKLQSIGKYSPFQGKMFGCSIARTIVRGETVFAAERGILVEPGYGKWLKRKQS